MRTLSLSYLLLSFMMPILVSCGAGSSGSSESARQTQQLDVNPPREEQFASTLLFPGNKSLYIEDRVDLVGTIKPQYIGRVSSVKIEADDINRKIELDENHIWRYPLLRLRPQIENRFKLHIELDDGTKLTDEYTIIRSLPLKEASSPLFTDDKKKAYFLDAYGSLFTVSIETGLVTPLYVTLEPGQLSWGPESGLIYLANQWSFLSYDPDTRNTVRISDMYHINDEQVQARTLLNDIVYDQSAGKHYFFMPATPPYLERNNLSAGQTQIILEVNYQTGELTEVAGAVKGVGDRFYFSGNMALNEQLQIMYVEDSQENKGIYEVDLVSGDRTKIFAYPGNPISDMTYDDIHSKLYASQFPGRVYEYDLVSNSVSLLVNDRRLADVIDHLEVLDGGNKLAMFGSRAERFEILDLASDQIREILPPLRDPFSDFHPNILKFHIDENTKETYFIGYDSSSLGVFSPDSKRVRKVSARGYPSKGEGPRLGRLQEFYRMEDGLRSLVGNEDGKLFWVNMGNGDRDLIETEVADGAELESITTIVVDEEKELAYIVDDESEKVVMVNLIDNSQVLLNKFEENVGNYPIKSYRDMVLDKKNNRLIISNSNYGSRDFNYPLLEINLSNLKRSPLLPLSEGKKYQSSFSVMELDDSSDSLYLSKGNKLFRFRLNASVVEKYTSRAIAVGEIEVPCSISDLQLDEQSRLMYAACDGIYAINTESLQSARFY